MTSSMTPSRARSRDVSRSAWASSGLVWSVATRQRLADQYHLEVAEAGEAGADRPVVAERPVAVQLDELVADHVDVVERLRPLLVPREQDRLPGREVAVEPALLGQQLAPQPADLLAPA